MLVGNDWILFAGIVLITIGMMGYINHIIEALTCKRSFSSIIQLAMLVVGTYLILLGG